ncbi:TPA: hypothetical protein EYP27_04620 [Candidatus Bathyarchaeota archaeon]|nr:hypothetical protein [Candidatus Bathyarchaeota archaeon]
MGLILREAKADILWFLRTGLCGILVHVEDGEIVKVGGDPSSPFHPFRGGKLCPKGMSAVEWHYHPDRLNFPLKRVREEVKVKWRRITWGQALDEILEIRRNKKRIWGEALATLGGKAGRLQRCYRWRETF